MSTITMISCLIYVLSVTVLTSGHNLCKDGSRIDSIAYIYSSQQWFFTSGGRYWFSKDGDFPPKDEGTPLPGGFKKGEAAIFRNSLEACANSPEPRRSEREIQVIEFVPGKGNMIMTFDTRYNTWSPQPISVSEDKGLSKAQIDWSKPIDTAFDYQMNKVVVIQEGKYSLVDLSDPKFCITNNKVEGKSYPKEPIVESFGAQGIIDAITQLGNKNNTLYLFQGDSFWPVTIQTEKDGKIKGIKGDRLNVLKHFFRFVEEDKCIYPDADKEEAQPTIAGPGAQGQKDAITSNETITESTDVSSESQTESQSTTTSESEKDGNSFPWYWIVIIIIIVIIILLIIICCCLAGKSKSSKDDRSSKDNEASASKAQSTTGATVRSKSGVEAGKVSSKAESKTGDAAVTTRSKMGAASGTGGAAASKTDSKTGADSATGGSAAGAGGRARSGVAGAGGKGVGAKSSMGTSPSTMSVRSQH